MSDITWHNHQVSKEARASKLEQKPRLIWFTGLSGSGKSTVAGALEKKLFAMGKSTYLLDGDNVRHGLNKDLKFSDKDRVENIRRIGEVGKLMVDAGLIVISAFISPFRSERRMVRRMMEQGEFIEVHLNTPIEVCEKRDPKGLYSKARRGLIANFTGIDSEYETPESPELSLSTGELSVDECVDAVIEYLFK